MQHCSGPNYQCMSGGILEGAGGNGGRGPASLGGWVNGGAGIAISAGLVSQVNFTSCLHYYYKHWPYGVAAADVLLGCCLQDSGAELLHAEGFSPGRPGFEECNCGEKGAATKREDEGSRCTPPADADLSSRQSFHHMGPNDMRSMWRKEEAGNPAAYRGKETFLGQPRGIRLYCGTGPGANHSGGAAGDYDDR
mmetsp:Transcript_57906/g.183699  ORF Transcript_57906/g.183699 Transcript_57906/m.183699 type:complete len:194 (+) Transcript_57906:190-771(+)